MCAMISSRTSTLCYRFFIFFWFTPMILGSACSFFALAFIHCCSIKLSKATCFKFIVAKRNHISKKCVIPNSCQWQRFPTQQADTEPQSGQTDECGANEWERTRVNVVRRVHTQYVGWGSVRLFMRFGRRRRHTDNMRAGITSNTNRK